MHLLKLFQVLLNKLMDRALSGQVSAEKNAGVVPGPLTAPTLPTLRVGA